MTMPRLMLFTASRICEHQNELQHIDFAKRSEAGAGAGSQRRDQSGAARTGWPSLSGCACVCHHLRVWRAALTKFRLRRFAIGWFKLAKIVLEPLLHHDSLAGRASTRGAARRQRAPRAVYGRRDATMILAGYQHGLRASELCSAMVAGRAQHRPPARPQSEAGLAQRPSPAGRRYPRSAASTARAGQSLHVFMTRRWLADPGPRRAHWAPAHHRPSSSRVFKGRKGPDPYRCPVASVRGNLTTAERNTL